MIIGHVTARASGARLASPIAPSPRLARRSARRRYLGHRGCFAFRAAGSHRAAVEAALDHHATTIAWRFAGEARSWVGFGMNEAGDALQRDVSRNTVLPGPEVLERLLAKKYCDCMTAAFGRTFVRVVLGPDPSLDLVGEPLPERAGDELRARMWRRRDMLPHKASISGVLPPGTPRLNRATDVALIWRVQGVTDVLVPYGMVVEPAQIKRPLIGAPENAQLFHQHRVASAATSFVRVEVAGPNGATLFAAGPETHPSRDHTLGTDYGNPGGAATSTAAAQVLIAGGLPAAVADDPRCSRCAGDGGAAVLLRREHRLARLREDFVSGVSHELRTPLTQIRMLSELLETDSFKSPAERARAVGIIHRESLRLTNLVDNILEFTRLRRAADTRELDHPPVSLAEVL